MDWSLEGVVPPVSDIHRSIEFYRHQIGFTLITTHRPST